VFRARSAARDAGPTASVQALFWRQLAINTALKAAEQEQAGLSARIGDVLARAAVTLGNGTDEYFVSRCYRQLLSRSIRQRDRKPRLNELAPIITHFKFRRAAVLSRFPKIPNNRVTDLELVTR
jgi:hypothetical protein